MCRARCLLPLLAFVLAGANQRSAGAQTTQAYVSGFVRDSISGQPVLAAEVSCQNQITRITHAQHLRKSGLYVFPLLSPGTYRFAVTAPGYQAQELYAIELDVASRLDLDFQLRPLSDVWESRTSQSITLPGSRQVLNFFGPDLDWSRTALFDARHGLRSNLQASLSDVVYPREIDALPLSGRDIYTTLVLFPGITSDLSTARGLGLSASGQRPTSSSYLLDGVENNNSLVTGPAAVLAPEAVEEYRLSINSFSAEYGRTAGFLANAITREAGSQWHGTAYDYVKNEVLNANGFGENRLGIGRAPLKEQQPGLALGGPLPWLHLFGSLAFEYDRFRSRDAPQTFVLPSPAFIAGTPAGTVTGDLLRRYPAQATSQSGRDAVAVQIAPPVSIDRYLAVPRLDYASPSGGAHVMLRYALSRTDEPALFFSPYPGFSSPYGQRAGSLAVGFIDQIGPNLTNEFRFAWSGQRIRLDRPHTEVPVLNLGEKLTVNGDTIPISLPGSQAFYAFDNRSPATEVVENAIANIGRHVIKFGGGLIHRANREILTAGQDGYYNFDSLATFQSATPRQFGLTTDLAAEGLTQPPFSREYSYFQPYAFVQDSWRLAPRLTLNLGVRYDIFGAPSNTGPGKDTLIQLGSGSDLPQRIAHASVETPLRGDQRIFDTDWGDAAVRFAAAYDLRGNGALVLRAAYGIFYDRPYDNLWANVIANRFQLSTFDGFDGPVNYLSSPLQVARAATFVSNDTEGNRIVFQPQLKNARVQNFFVGVQQRLGENITLEIDGLGSLGRKLITTDVINRIYSSPDFDPILGRFNLDPRLQDLDYRSNQGKSDYYALATSARFRFQRFTGKVSYTYGHAIDNQSDPLAGAFGDFNFFGNSSAAQITQIAAFTRQFDSQSDRGNADFDQRHNLVFFGVWELPGSRSSGRANALLRDWRVSGLGAVRSGFPYSVYASTQPTGSPQPDLIHDRAVVLNPAAAHNDLPVPGGKQLLNLAAFGNPAPDTIGSGRNVFEGPGLFNIDASLARSFHLSATKEERLLTLRVDAFNVLNHANLNNPLNTSLNNPTVPFGVAYYGRQEINSGFPLSLPLGETARQLQVMLRLQF